MILLSELSRRRIRSINKLLRVGKNEVVMVIRVDKEKKYIDLSKRRVSGEDIRRADERFNKAKTVHGVMRHVGSKLRVPIHSLYQRVAWPLCRRYGNTLDAFQLSVTDPTVLEALPGVSDEEKREIHEYIRGRMMPQPLKIRADIQVTCFAYEGVNAVKEALIAAQSCSTEDIQIKVQLIAPPLYVMLTTTPDGEQGKALLNAAITEAKRVLTQKGGELVVKMEPTVTTTNDDSQLDRMLEELALDKEGVDDDDDDDEGGEDETLGDVDFESGGGGGLEDLVKETVRLNLAPSGGGGGASAAGAALASQNTCLGGIRVGGVGMSGGAVEDSSTTSVALASTLDEDGWVSSSNHNSEAFMGTQVVGLAGKKKKARAKVVSAEDDD